MAEPRISILGIRHHGPGSARMVVRALEALKPDAVLIEGPPDAADVLPLAADPAMVPPVALLVYDPEQPQDSSYYPFTEFSPEWQAIRWALGCSAAVRFIDLPQTMRARRVQIDPPDAETSGDTTAPFALPSQPAPQPGPALSAELPPAAEPPPDALEALARAAGFSDGEAWWGRLIEERRAGDNPLDVFSAIHEAMAAARKELGPTPHDPSEQAREAHMRKAIRQAVKEGFGTIAVICGAWHAPVLTAEAIKTTPAKADDEILKELVKGQPKRKVAATWIPWTYNRLTFESGYGAGVVSPGWYEHLWIHHEQVSTRWMTKVARFMREEDLDASPASVIESVRLADTLAALRGRSITGLDELSDATLAVLCQGNPLPMRIIEQKLIVGNRLGEIPESTPSVPLLRDIAAQQKSLRMKLSAVEAVLDLDQRKETDLARSRLLHRLSLLGIPWGELHGDQKQGTSTFHEIWTVQWKPEFAVLAIEAARWGNTVESAATARIKDRARNAEELAELTGLLDGVMLADLPSAVEVLSERIGALSAVAASISSLMDALPPLVRILRYGNVRATDAALVEPLVRGLLARICAGLGPACGSLDDDAAGAMRDRLGAVAAALGTLASDEFSMPWLAELRKLGESDIHGLVAGRAWRLLLDAHACDTQAAADRIALALSPGNDPSVASAWIEGFLAGSGAVLVHDQRLLAIIDRWVASLTPTAFEQACPIVRRTFSSFAQPERRIIGENLKRGLAAGGDAGGPATPTTSDDYDAQRGELMDPVLKLILGKQMP